MIKDKQGGRMRNRWSQYEVGAVSIFIVIFTSVLLTGVIVGFTLLMMSDQERSTDNDLSQSARDSAEAGIEDAKRVIAQLAECTNRGLIGAVGPEGANCTRIDSAVNGKTCDTIDRALGVSGQKERKIAQTEGDKKLDQAYTCVTIDPDTEAFVGEVSSEDGDLRVVPLRGTANFDTVELSWLTRGNVPDKVNFALPSGPTPSDSRDSMYIPLPTKENWGKRGSVLRIGTILYTPDHIDTRQIDERARTAFLYAGTKSTPTEAIDLSDTSVDVHKPLDAGNALDAVPDAVNAAMPVKCQGVNPGTVTLEGDGYLCKTTIRVKNIADPSLVQLTLASVYRNTNFSIVLKDSTHPSDVIKFRGVQPEVDSTGRANDVFRRIVARVEPVSGGATLFPRAAVSTSGSFCKGFTVTDNPADYSEDAAVTASGSGCYSLNTGNGPH